MSLLHIGVALCLSAAAAFLVTGATMRPIEPDCPAGGHWIRDEPGCLPVDGAQDAVVPGGSGFDADGQDTGRFN